MPGMSLKMPFVSSVILTLVYERLMSVLSALRAGQRGRRREDRQARGDLPVLHGKVATGRHGRLGRRLLRVRKA